jgi:hypothetical protein
MPQTGTSANTSKSVMLHTSSRTGGDPASFAALLAQSQAIRPALR